MSMGAARQDRGGHRPDPLDAPRRPGRHGRRRLLNITGRIKDLVIWVSIGERFGTWPPKSWAYGRWMSTVSCSWVMGLCEEGGGVPPGDDADAIRAVLPALRRATGLPIVFGAYTTDRRTLRITELLGTHTDSLRGLAVKSGFGLGGQGTPTGPPL